MTDIERVDDYLEKAGAFYLTTVDGDKPKCRPIGFHMVLGDKLYFGIGEFKDVYKQLQKNPNAEICALVGTDFLRYYGKAVFETKYELAEKALEAMPALKQIYNEETGNKLGIFHLEEATAEFRSMMSIKESIKFK